MANTSRDFMKQAEHIIALAMKEAQRLNHRYLGTEHILLALVADEEGIVAKALSSSGIKPDKVRVTVDFIVGRGDRAPDDKIRLTPRAKRVIELAQEEAHRLNYGYCGSEHLFVGILREGEGVAASVLETLVGPGLDRVTKEITILSGKCRKCGGQIIKATVDYPVVLKGKTIIVGGVPAEVCSHCGELIEVQLDSELEEKVEYLLESAAPPHRVAKVPVYEVADIR